MTLCVACTSNVEIDKYDGNRVLLRTDSSVLYHVFRQMIVENKEGVNSLDSNYIATYHVKKDKLGPYYCCYILNVNGRDLNIDITESGKFIIYNDSLYFPTEHYYPSDTLDTLKVYQVSLAGYVRRKKTNR
jgi:hypothetical protein